MPQPTPSSKCLTKPARHAPSTQHRVVELSNRTTAPTFRVELKKEILWNKITRLATSLFPPSPSFHSKQDLRHPHRGPLSLEKPAERSSPYCSKSLFKRTHSISSATHTHTLSLFLSLYLTHARTHFPPSVPALSAPAHPRHTLSRHPTFPLSSQIPRRDPFSMATWL